MSSSEDTGRRIPAALVGVLALALVVAVVTRWLGLDFGTPDLWHPDEQRLVYNPAKRLAAGESMGLARWPYPPLMAELVGLVLRLFPFDPPTLRAIAVGRGISAGFGVIGVLASALAAWRLTQRAAPSVAAAGLMACSPIAIQLGHYATPDGAALGCVGLVTWACAQVVADPHADRPWSLLAAGAATGLAAAFKYNAAMIAVLVIGAALARAIAREGDRRARLQGAARDCAWLSLAGLIAGAVFVATLIPVWGEIANLGRGLETEWGHYGTGHPGFSTRSPGSDTLTTLWVCGLGPPAMLALIGVTLTLDRARVMAALALVASAVYLGLLARQQVFFDRVVFVVLPPLALAAALCGDAIVQALANRLIPDRARAQLGLSWAMVAVLVAAPVTRGAQLVVALRTPDTRARARAYLRGVSQRKQKILHVPSVVYLSPSIRGRKNVRPNYRKGPLRPLRRRPHYVVLVDGYWERFDNSPIDVANERRLYDAWRRALAKGYVVARTFEGPPLPCSTCPGTTLAAYHQPKITVYVRADQL